MSCQKLRMGEREDVDHVRFQNGHLRDSGLIMAIQDMLVGFDVIDGI